MTRRPRPRGGPTGSVEGTTAEARAGTLPYDAPTDPAAVEYQPAGDGAAAKTPDDSVTIDLKSRTIAHCEALR